MSQFEVSFKIILSVVTHSLNKLRASGKSGEKSLKNVELEIRGIVVLEKKLKVLIITFSLKILHHEQPDTSFPVTKIAISATNVANSIFGNFFTQNVDVTSSNKYKIIMITLIGAKGYVGRAMVNAFEHNQISFTSLSRVDLDYYNAVSLKRYLGSNQSQFLINCAGFTGKPNVDACEIAKYECLHGNAVLPGIIREVCEDLKIPWGHVSSGCIYSGRRSDGGGWKEEDEPNFSFRSPPCSFYSGTKALGEEVLEGAENCFIWRLRIPFNHDPTPRNYLQKLLNYDNLFEAKNSVSHLEEFCQKCIESFTKDIEPGIYNMTNPGSIITSQATKWMIQEGLTDKKFNFFKSEEEFMEKAAKTPRSNCVLDTTKAEKAGIGMRPVEEAMIDSIRKMRHSVIP